MTRHAPRTTWRAWLRAARRELLWLRLPERDAYQRTHPHHPTPNTCRNCQRTWIMHTPVRDAIDPRRVTSCAHCATPLYRARLTTTATRDPMHELIRHPKYDPDHPERSASIILTSPPPHHENNNEEEDE